LGHQCATTTLTRTITVAAGVYAPGHLGELTRHVPFDLVDAVLAETGRVQQRLRMLPSRVGVYLLLAMGLYEHVGLAGIWSKLVAGLGALNLATPSARALRKLRARVGAAPLRVLLDTLAVPLAPPSTPGVFYRCWRTVAVDGCLSLKVADAAANRAWLGKIEYRMACAGYPSPMLMALVETGTRGLLGAVFGPASLGEIAYANQLLPRLDTSMLLLADRAFDAGAFLNAVAARGAQLLIRIRSLRRPPVLAVLPDGSYLSVIDGLKVRILEATLTATTAQGTPVSDRYRLVTTLLDHRRDPAPALLGLYHERWEIESAYYALRHTLLRARVLRSHDPDGLDQELWALLCTYQILRMAMTEATDSQPGTDPDRASFTITLETARDQLTNAAAITGPGPEDTITNAILARLLPARRPRTSTRKVKSPISRYHARRAGDPRPDTSIPLTSIDILIHPPHTTAPPPTRPPRGWSSTTPAPPARANLPAPTGRLHRILELLRAHPHRAWPRHDIATHLAETNTHSLRTQLCYWARTGIITKTTAGHYTLNDQQTALTAA